MTIQEFFDILIDFIRQLFDVFAGFLNAIPAGLNFGCPWCHGGGDDDD